MRKTAKSGGDLVVALAAPLGGPSRRCTSPERIVLEATGGYATGLVAALGAKQLAVVVVNPRQVRDFARATGQLAKTDRLDAGVLAHFGEGIQPEVRPRTHGIRTPLVDQKWARQLVH